MRIPFRRIWRGIVYQENQYQEISVKVLYGHGRYIEEVSI